MSEPQLSALQRKDGWLHTNIAVGQGQGGHAGQESADELGCNEEACVGEGLALDQVHGQRHRRVVVCPRDMPARVDNSCECPAAMPERFVIP